MLIKAQLNLRQQFKFFTEVKGPMLKYCENFEYFVEKLGEYIQEKSATRIDNFLNRNKSEWKHEIPDGMVSLAICTTTIRNKLEMGESPVITLKILNKWNCDLAENKCQSFRMLLYSMYTMDDDDPLLSVSFDIIEYLLLVTDVDIQRFDCHDLEEEESILMVSCPMDVDKSVYLSFQKINILRYKQLEILKVFLINACNLEDYLGPIIAQFIWAPYKFYYDIKDYDEITGEYKCRKT